MLCFFLKKMFFSQWNTSFFWYCRYKGNDGTVLSFKSKTKINKQEIFWLTQVILVDCYVMLCHFWLLCRYRYWNTELVSSSVSLTSWGEGASLVLVGNPSNDSVTVKMPYGVDVLHQPSSHPIFSYWVG